MISVHDHSIQPPNIGIEAISNDSHAVSVQQLNDISETRHDSESFHYMIQRLATRPNDINGFDIQTLHVDTIC